MCYEIAMTITCSDIQRIFDDRKQGSDDAVTVVCQTLELIKNRRDLDPELIPKITAIAEKSNSKSIEWIAAIVCALTEIYSDAWIIISELSESRHVSGRLCAIYALSPKSSDEFATSILEPLISDPISTKVRVAAVNWIGSHNKSHLSDILKFALHHERNENIRKLINHEMTLLVYGYLVERNKDPAAIIALVPHGRISVVLTETDLQRLSDREIFELYSPKLRQVV